MITIKNKLFFCSIAALLTASLTSCSDWDDHYVDAAAGSHLTSWQTLQNNPEVSNFCKVLQETKVFRHHKKTEISYADMLNGGQAFTVFAPTNDKFTAEMMQSLLDTLATAKGDSVVEKSFILNHLSRTLTSNNGEVQDVVLANGKHLKVGQGKVGTVNIVNGNQRTKNGVLHITDDVIPYGNNIFEALCNVPALQKVGKQIRRYSEDYFDENASVSNGVVDGVKVYADSVIVERNILLDYVGKIDSEDSVYYVVAPSNEGWEKAYETAKKYFKYPSTIEGRDSLQELWATHALLSDAIFSRTIQDSPEDSLITYAYNRRRPDGHVFHKPFAHGGIMGDAKAVIPCSNGTLYQTEEWPFTPQETYFRTIRVEAEDKSNLIDYDIKTNKFTDIERTHYADSISENGYRYIKPNPTTENWNATFRVNGTLAGEYDIYLVILPKTIHDSKAEDLRPNRFKVEVRYTDANGKTVVNTGVSKTQEGGGGTTIDYHKIASVSFPVCNYVSKPNENVTVKIECSISNSSSTQTKNFTRDMYLDCIVLVPKGAEPYWKKSSK